VQSGRGEDENRIAFGENASRKVAGSLELTATLVQRTRASSRGPAREDGSPRGLQFNDGEAALAVMRAGR